MTRALNPPSREHTNTSSESPGPCSSVQRRNEAGRAGLGLRCGRSAGDVTGLVSVAWTMAPGNTVPFTQASGTGRSGSIQGIRRLTEALWAAK